MEEKKDSKGDPVECFKRPKVHDPCPVNAQCLRGLPCPPVTGE